MGTSNGTELVQLLKDTIEYLKKENENLRKTNGELMERIQELNQTAANLNETVEYLKRKLFGTSRERQEDDPNQLSFFNEAEKEADPAVPEPKEEEVVAGYQRQKKGKNSRDGIYGDLPVQEILCSMEEEDKKCPLCGEEMQYIGKRFCPRGTADHSGESQTDPVLPGSVCLPEMQGRG